MAEFNDPKTRLFQTAGIMAPYIAVLVGVFWLKNVLLAVLFYHAVLLVCIFGISRLGIFKQLAAGVHRFLTPLFILGGLTTGVIILVFWPLAVRSSVDLSHLLALLRLGPPWFLIFAAYACLVNPILEEAFWRGGFENRSPRPTAVDAAFAAYHALAVVPILKPHFVLLVFAAMTFVAWLFRALARRTGGLLTPYLVHLAADIAILAALWSIIR